MVIASPKSILEQILDPLADCFTPDVAQRIVAIPLATGWQERIDELAGKANEGLLSEYERAEYEQYIEAMDLLGIVKAKARLVLSRHAR